MVEIAYEGSSPEVFTKAEESKTYSTEFDSPLDTNTSSEFDDDSIMFVQFKFPFGIFSIYGK